MSTIGRGRKPSKAILSNEQIRLLSEKFNSSRRQLVCHNCNETNSFYRNGNTPGNPPQPSYICKSCGKTYNAPTMVEILDLTFEETNPNPSEHSQMEISRSENRSDALSSSIDIA